MTELEDALRATLRTHERDIDASTIQRDYAAIASQRMPTQRLLPALIAGAVVAIVGLVAYVAWPLGGTATDQPVGRPTAQNIAPPPAASGPFQVWLSERVIPVGGADVAAALTGPAEPMDEDQQTFGVGARVDRWDGEQWQPHRDVRLCMDFWDCVGELYPPDDQLGVEGIGLSLDASGVGPTTLVRIDGLDPGWYRLRQTSNDGVEANGIFEVVPADDVETVPLGARDPGRLRLQPAFLPTTGGFLSINRLQTSQAALDAGDPGPPVGDVLDLEMWADASWHSMGTVHVNRDATAGITGASIPELAIGAYRLVDSSQPVEAQAVFWVTDNTSATPLPVGPQ
jgi:hypothetical protein